jgi:hypothetical protein
VTDIAIDVVKRVQNDMKKEIEAQFVPESESIQDEKYSKYRLLYEKIKPEWKEEDRAALAQLKESATAVYSDIFEDAFAILDRLYSAARVPMRNSRGKPVKDENGRIVWDTDEWGSPKEDWNSLSSNDIDAALIKLQEQKFTITLRVRELFLETVFAKQSLQDDWHDSYQSMLEGTNPMREAVANRKTKDEKWMYFFRYYIWHYASGFNDELDKTINLLSRIREWRSNRNV